jgi:phage-related protein
MEATKADPASAEGSRQNHTFFHTQYGIYYRDEDRTEPMAEKPLYWVGTAKKDLLAFPGEAVDDIGYALGVVQLGGTPPSAKAWKGEGPGVFEIVEDHRGDTYRAVYTVRYAKAVYVLHCFQKKSPSGIRTAKKDIDMIHERLKAARADYEERHGQED